MSQSELQHLIQANKVVVKPANKNLRWIYVSYSKREYLLTDEEKDHLLKTQKQGLEYADFGRFILPTKFSELLYRGLDGEHSSYKDIDPIGYKIDK